MEVFQNLLKQIEDQATVSTSQLDEYTSKVDADLHEYIDDTKLKIKELEIQIESDINKMIAEKKPDEAKIKAFSDELKAAFNEMVAETDRQIVSLDENIKEKMVPLRTKFEQLLVKVNTFMLKTTEIVAKVGAQKVVDGGAKQEAFDKMLAEHRAQMNAMQTEALSFQKSVMEMIAQITRDIQKKTAEVTERNQQKYDELVKKFVTTFKS